MFERSSTSESGGQIQRWELVTEPGAVAGGTGQDSGGGWRRASGRNKQENPQCRGTHSVGLVRGNGGRQKEVGFLTWVLRTGLVPERRGAGVAVKKERAKTHLTFRLVGFAVHVGHPG